MARALALVAAIAVSLLAVSGAGGADAQTPKRGGTVVVGPVGEFACLSPFKECAAGLEFLWIFGKVLPGAFARARDSTWRPALVSGVTFTRTPPYTLTYTIRPEARWSDGVPVTARDFVFTHRATRRYGVAVDAHRTLVRSVRAVDAKTVRVVLRSRFAGWRGGLFGFVLPQHALVGEDLARIWADGIENPKTGRPIGSGPFVVGSWARGKQLTLVRNPSYWGLHKAYLDRLILRFCVASCAGPAEVLESMRTGAVDFAFFRNAEIVPDLRRIRGMTVRLLRTNGYEHVDFRVESGGHPALRIKRVRQAFAYSIDRAEIVRRLWGEIDPTYRPLQSAVLLNTDGHYAPNWSGYSYRPNLARSLLERAGCRRGADGIYACGGERLSFRFATLAGGGPRQIGLELMQPQLRRVGIEVVLSYSPALAFFDRTFSGDFDVVSFGWFVDGFGHTELYGCGGFDNHLGYCQRLVTADLDQADRILDDAQRARVLNRVDRQLARDVPVIPLYQIPWVYAYKDTLRNVVPSPTNLLWNAEDWWLER